MLYSARRLSTYRQIAPGSKPATERRPPQTGSLASPADPAHHMLFGAVAPSRATSSRLPTSRSPLAAPTRHVVGRRGSRSEDGPAAAMTALVARRDDRSAGGGSCHGLEERRAGSAREPVRRRAGSSEASKARTLSLCQLSSSRRPRERSSALSPASCATGGDGEGVGAAPRRRRRDRAGGGHRDEARPGGRALSSLFPSLPPPTSHSFVPRPVPSRLDLAPVPSRHERPPPRARRPRRLLLALTSSLALALDHHVLGRRRAASPRSRHARLGRRERLKPRRRPGAASGRRPGRLGSLGCVSLASGSPLQPLS